MPYTHHAFDRAAERYGVYATADQWAAAVLSIIATTAGEDRSALLLRRLPKVEHWIVRLAGEAVVAVYDPNQALIITVLPPC